MADLSGELHHRQRKPRVVCSQNALLNCQGFAKRLLRMGRVIDGIVSVTGSGKLVKTLEVAAAKATAGRAMGDQTSGFRRGRSRDRSPAENTKGCFERGKGRWDGIGGEYPTADRGSHREMRPSSSTSGALQQNRRGAVEDPCRGRRAAGKTCVQIIAPRPGDRQIIKVCDVRVAQLDNSPARCSPISAVKRHGAQRGGAEFGGRQRLEMAGLSNFVLAYGNGLDRRRLRPRNISGRRRGCTAGEHRGEPGA